MAEERARRPAVLVMVKASGFLAACPAWVSGETSRSRLPAWRRDRSWATSITGMGSRGWRSEADLFLAGDNSLEADDSGDAERLGLKRTTLHSRMKKLGIGRPE